MVMLFTVRKFRCRDLALSRSAAATLASRSFSARRRLIGSVHMEATIPIAATGHHTNFTCDLVLSNKHTRSKLETKWCMHVV